MIIHCIDVLYVLKKMTASRPHACNLFLVLPLLWTAGNVWLEDSEAKLKMSRVRVESSFSSF